MDYRCKIICYIKKCRELVIVLFFQGICVGVFSGIGALLYRYLIECAELARQSIYEYLKGNNPLITLMWFVMLCWTGYALGVLVKKEPVLSGSGIYQVKDALSSQSKPDWIKVVAGKFVGGTLAICAGLSLGRGGPSIQIGAAIGQGFAGMVKKFHANEKYFIVSGASAGLAAAFHTPIAGAVFALEGIYKKTSLIAFITAISASITTNLVSGSIFGSRPIFDFGYVAPLPIKYYIYILALGLILGLLGILFNNMLLKTHNIFHNQKWLLEEFIPLFPLLAAGVLGFILPDVLGGGSGLIIAIAQKKFMMTILIILVSVKSFMTILSYGSGVPGGLILPSLSLGALIGCIYGNILAELIAVDPVYINSFVVLSMAGFFTAVMKAPVTGIIIIMEMTGCYSELLLLTIICAISHAVTVFVDSNALHHLLGKGMRKISVH